MNVAETGEKDWVIDAAFKVSKLVAFAYYSLMSSTLHIMQSGGELVKYIPKATGSSWCDNNLDVYTANYYGLVDERVELCNYWCKEPANWDAIIRDVDKVIRHFANCSLEHFPDKQPCRQQDFKETYRNIHDYVKEINGIPSTEKEFKKFGKRARQTKKSWRKS